MNRALGLETRAPIHAGYSLNDGLAPRIPRFEAMRQTGEFQIPNTIHVEGYGTVKSLTFAAKRRQHRPARIPHDFGKEPCM